nr:hypothetical protein [Tanacetum cinerariifolium]
NQLGDLSTHSTEYNSPALTQKVFANIRRVGKGCLGVETPLFKGMLVAKEPENQGDAEEQGATEEQGGPRSRDSKSKNKGEKLERANKVKTIKLRRLRKVGTSQGIESSDDTLMEDVSNQGRVIDKSDKNEGVETPLFEGMLVAKEPENQGDAEEQGTDNTAAEEHVTIVDDVADHSIQSSTPLTPPPQQPQNIPSTS